MFPQGNNLQQVLKALPDSAVRDRVQYVRKRVKDTVLVANGDREASLFTSKVFTTTNAKKTRYQNTMVGTEGRVFGDSDAWIRGIRIIVPRYKADGTTITTFADAHNLLASLATFKIEGTPILDMDAEDFPAGQGMTFQATEVTAAATPAFSTYYNGLPAVANVFEFDEPLYIKPTESVECFLEWPSGIVLTANAHLVGKLDAYVARTPRN